MIIWAKKKNICIHLFFDFSEDTDNNKKNPIVDKDEALCVINLSNTFNSSDESIKEIVLIIKFIAKIYLTFDKREISQQIK